MSEKNFYQQAQEALAAHLRQQQERRERQARADQEAAERLVHVMERKVRDGVKKGETHFEVLIQRHGGTTTAVRRAVERLQEMGFPRENISWTPETLRVSVDPLEGFGQQDMPDEPVPDGNEHMGITNAWLEKVEPPFRREEAQKVAANLVAFFNQHKNGESTATTLKVTSNLMRLFECDRRDWVGFCDLVKSNIHHTSSSNIILDFEADKNTITFSFIS